MKLPTQSDVAKLAGVSRATVSYVLNDDPRFPNHVLTEETRKKVVDAAKQLGYVPNAQAQALKSGNTNTIAYILPDFHNPHFAEYADGIEREAMLHGYRVLISSTDLNEKYAIEIFRDLSGQRIDGIILGSASILNSEEGQRIFSQLMERKFPMLVFTRQFGLDSIKSDYSQATLDVMAYLFSLNHKRIGFIDGVGGKEPTEDRFSSYKAALKNQGINLDPEIICNCGPTIEDGYQAAKKLLSVPSRPTAMIAINDLLAMGAMRAAFDLGLSIPGDLSVVGFDNISMSGYLSPRLTTVNKDTIFLGRKSFQLLYNRIQNPDLPRQLFDYPAKLLIRESTGPAPF